MKHPLSHFAVILAASVSLALSGCATKSANPAPSPAPVAASVAQPAAGAKPPPKGPKPSLLSQALGGFGIWQKLFPPKKQIPKALPAHLIGTVKLVNKDDNFVLIDTISYSNSAPGTPLLCIMNERQTATLKLSSLRNPPFLIADITDGNPSPGDRVYQP